MRPTHELLQILLDHVEEVDGGLCGLACKMEQVHAISEDEYSELTEYIRKYMPKRWHGAIFGWPVGEIEPRRQWLIERIEIEKPK